MFLRLYDFYIISSVSLNIIVLEKISSLPNNGYLRINQRVFPGKLVVFKSKFRVHRDQYAVSSSVFLLSKGCKIFFLDWFL